MRPVIILLLLWASSWCQTSVSEHTEPFQALSAPFLSVTSPPAMHYRLSETEMMIRQNKDKKHGMVHTGFKWTFTALGAGFGIASLANLCLSPIQHSTYSQATDEDTAYEEGKKLDEINELALIFSGYSAGFFVISLPFWIW